jgi:hypothetical protein
MMMMTKKKKKIQKYTNQLLRMETARRRLAKASHTAA